ncbi:hypothetical protein [Allosphingosinicella humi]
MSSYRMAGAGRSAPSVPDFDPVPLRARRDGWIGERQRAFVAALHATRSVSKAARAVGMSRETAYRLRERPGAQSFAAAWDAAFALPVHVPTSADLLWHRAFYGTVRPIIRRGKEVGVAVKPDNQALLTLMRRFDRLAEGAERRERSQRNFRTTQSKS